MRLHWFTPHRANTREGSRRYGRAASLFRRLGILGVSWEASPMRRMIQAFSLASFLYLFFVVCWPYGSQHHADAMRGREIIEAETFLALDPLVGLTTAIAARTWVWSLSWAAILLVACLVVPRAFCGYLCPLGTLIDLFDWCVGKRVLRFRVQRRGYWVHLKYYILTGVLVTSLFGVLLAGFVAAIPVVTRGLLFLLGPLQLGVARGWYLVPPMNAGHFVSLGLFFSVFALGFLAPRFWCRYVCPSGAVFSVANRLRASSRSVDVTCISCDQCVQVCPFDAIKPDFSTRFADCTLCQTCAGVCPTGAIEYKGRWEVSKASPGDEAPSPMETEIALSRRGFVASACAASFVAVAIDRWPFRTAQSFPDGSLLRPPGSVPEAQFLQLCIQCGECFKACPFNVLQPAGFELGVRGLWTPRVLPDGAGCDPSCANCGQVCPTGAIRALPLEEKRVARIGLALVDEATCLPLAGKEACQLCVDECTAAGYDAIEFLRVGVETDEAGMPVEGTGWLAPEILPELCVGCGLCQARCYAINVKEKRSLSESAVQIVAGAGKEDRLVSGSYRALREAERRKKAAESDAHPQGSGSGGDYLPDFLK